MKEIATHYAKGSCVLDLIAIIPFRMILGEKIKSEKSRLLGLFKLLRVPRLFGLLDVERFKRFITQYYNNRLEEKVRKNIETENYPILKQLMYIQLYKIIRLVIIIFTFSYFLAIFWHIIVCDYFNSIESDEKNFCTVFLNQNSPISLRLVQVWYFAFTTLSTIGFGDFVAVSTKERWIASVILLFGVSTFSFIIGQFIEIMGNYRILWQSGNH